ncbi:hypothetical protein VQL36_13225 [Chengkuizengella sp. SCS-71B]|uniref:hypothetical protein n=1 Tax=Chengkuizengella sp. SCS-71B TaxID=3115290 RepID=UPI0032C21AC6
MEGGINIGSYSGITTGAGIVLVLFILLVIILISAGGGSSRSGTIVFAPNDPFLGNVSL